MGRVVGLKRGILQLFLLSISLQICTLLAPIYLQLIVDNAVVTADRDFITVLGLGFLLLLLLQGAIGGVRAWTTAVFSSQLNFQWLGNALTHLMKLPLPYFESRHLGDIISRFGSIQKIQNGLTTQFVEATIDGLLVIITFGVMMYYSQLLASLSVVVIGFYAALRWVLMGFQQNAMNEEIIHSSQQYTHLLESVRGVQTVRLFNRSDERRNGWLNYVAEEFNSKLRNARLNVINQVINALLFGAERIAIVWMCAIMVLDARFSIGMLFAFLSYKEQFSLRAASLVDKLVELRMLRIHGDRVADIIHTTPEKSISLMLTDELDTINKIELRNIGFRYSDFEPYILKNINLTFISGQCVAITGPSGCGKTTLLKILLGLINPTEGEVKVNDQPLDLYGLMKYRQHIGTVMQDDYLFTGSIADNICFFDPSP